MHDTQHLIYPAAACVCAAFLSSQRLIPYRSMEKPLAFTAVSACLLHLFIGGWHEVMTAAICAVAAVFLFLIVYALGGIPLQDVLAIGTITLAGGSQQMAPLLLFTALVGAIMACIAAEKRQKVTRFLQTCIRESTHAPYAESAMTLPAYAAPEAALRRYYGHAITIGALLTLVQAATY